MTTDLFGEPLPTPTAKYSPRMRVLRRCDPVPKHIRLQWIPANAYRYTNQELADLFGVTRRTIQYDLEDLGLHKYITDDYVRPARGYFRRPIALSGIAA